jgi:hypothetical protein
MNCPVGKRVRKLAVVAFTLLLLTVTIPTVGRATNATPRADTTATVAASVLGRAHARLPATVSLRVVLIAVGFACAVSALTASRQRWSVFTPRTRRCSNDVGHDWRALLLGAPPVRA